jgi:CYTH domain-containing protein
MPLEIERKYIVAGTPWDAYPKVKKTVIKQGYISKSPKHTVRIRVTDKKALITIKGPTKGFTRAEYEYEIPYDDGQELLKMCDGGIIDKIRYTFADKHKQVWEVDVFHGINEGLVVAEIELPSEDTAITIPDWVVREVTFDKRYTNAYISNHKIPTEEDVL